MKKLIFIVLILLCISVNIFAINGDGSFGTPYNGPLTQSMTWSGKVYVNGDVTVNGFTLTVNPAATVVFLASGSDIIITGTGSLNASGGAGSNMIRFTADFNNNGSYGEPGERWGHISFQNMAAGFTGQSIINYCIVEFGLKGSATWNYESSGGGIQVAYSNVSISNSIIRNNFAGWGGGIYVNLNSSPLISNCIISNNQAGTTGGGMSIYQHSASIVSNCIIEKNICNGAGGGGGVFLGDYPDNIVISNCVIASNITNSQSNNIRIWKSAPSTGPKLYNTIVWGSNNSIHYYQIGASPTDFNYCAIQGYTTGYTNCINLSATNLSPTGPNFSDPDNLDYSITYNSICRDAGTLSNAPATDFLGNPRIGLPDIGAYEVHFIRWNGSVSTIWSSTTNWDGGADPYSGLYDIIIPSGLTNYPTGDPNLGYVIGLGRTMILGPGAKASFNSLRNNGSLILQSDATGISSLIVNNNVTATIDLFLTGGNPGAPLLKLNKWHFISSPVINLPVSTFAPVTKNVVMWYDSQVSGTLATGWIAYNGYRYSTGVIDGPTFSSLVPGIGYDYYAATDQKYTFTGSINYSDVSVPLSYAFPDALHGFNLLGNPYSSGLNWDDIVNGVYYPYPAATSKFLYFTRDNAQCSYIGGVGIPADVTGIIPPMQGFFVLTYAPGNTLTIPAAARTQGAIHPRYKGLEIIPLVRLQLSEALLSDETVVRFDAAAKSGFDNDFDAPKMFLSPDLLSIYSSMGGTNYAIDGLPFPDTFVEIPIVVNLLTSGTHTITSTQLQGLDNYDVTLKDKVTGFEAKLRENPILTFTGVAGTAADRFILKVGKISTGVEDPKISESIFNIYPGNSHINIQTVSDIWEGKSGTVKVIDLTGKIVESLNNCEFSKNSLVQLADPVARGIYIVEIKSGLMRYVGKVVIK